MFTKPTLFVIGAGASYELGLPLGGELLFRVAKCLDNADFLNDFYNRYKIESGQRANFSAAAARLAHVLPSSAFRSRDDGLNWFSNDPVAVTMGKIGIAHELLKAERESVLIENGLPAPLAAAGKSWLPNFFQVLIAGAQQYGLPNLTQNVKIINFNYDRTIEEYLWRALQEHVGLAGEIATQIVNRLEIIRPYGTLGDIRGNATSSISFGQPDGYDLIKVAAGIRTFTEQQNDDVAEKIKYATTWSRVVIFLGCGFHKQNMIALRPSELSRRHIFATMHGMSDSNKQALEILLRSSLSADNSSRILLQQLTAKGLFETLGSALSATV